MLSMYIVDFLTMASSQRGEKSIADSFMCVTDWNISGQCSTVLTHHYRVHLTQEEAQSHCTQSEGLHSTQPPGC